MAAIAERMQKPEETDPDYRYSRTEQDSDRDQGRDMKFAACVTIGFSIAVAVPAAMTASANAATEQCRFVQEKAEREACYQRQEAARVVKQKTQAAREAEQSKPLEPMTSDDVTLARAMHGICRGC